MSYKFTAQLAFILTLCEVGYEACTFIALVILLAISSGCVSAKTTIPPSGEKCASDGIVYHLPLRKFILSVTLNEAAKITAVMAQASDPIPDINRNLEFCGSFHRNLFAENTADFEVGTSGLLTTVDADSKPKIAEALKKLATAAGSVTPPP